MKRTRRVDIRVHNARDIKNTKSETSKVAQSPFFRVAIFRSGTNRAVHKAQESGVAHNEGVNPTWNKSGPQDFSFKVDDAHFHKGGNLYLFVNIFAKNKYFPHRSIGEACIQLTGLKESPPNDVLSYPLTSSTGGCFGGSANKGTVTVTITVGPQVKTPHFWYRPFVGLTGGGSDALPGMALGYAMGVPRSGGCDGGGCGGGCGGGGCGG